MTEAGRDNNGVWTLIALSSVDGVTPVTLWADPVTHRLLVQTTVSFALDDLSDVVITSGAQGDILYHNGTNWVNLAAGTNGHFLKTQGAGANPVWAEASGGAGTPGGADTQVQFNDGGSFGGDAGFVYNKATDTATLVNLVATTVAVSGGITSTVANTVNVVGLTVTQNDTTNNPRAVSLVNTGTGATLFIDPNGNASTSTSVGGAILLENTGNSGAGMVIYSNHATATGRLLSVRADNTGFATQVVYVENDGASHAVSIVHNSTGANALGLSIVSVNPNDTTLGINGQETGKGTFKVTHTYVGTADTNASAISILLGGTSAGTAAQGIFMDSTAGQPTTGKLLNLRNDGAEMLTLSAAGVLATAGSHVPTVSDTAALGTTALMWSDLFLASGGVINWNNGDVTITHSANTLAFAGASTGYTFDKMPTVSSVPVGIRGATIVIAPSNAADTTRADVVLTGTADQTAINTAIGNLPAAGGRIVFLDGLISVSGAIVINKSNVTLQGQGDGTNIKLANASNANVIEMGAAAGNHSRITVRDIFIDGNESNQTTGGNGIEIMASTTYASVLDCRIKNTLYANIYVSGTADDVTIHDNILDTTSVGDAFANIEGGGDRISIIGNTCISGDYGGIALYNSTTGAVISGNQIITPTGMGIECIIWDAVVSGNFILNPGQQAILNDGNPAQIIGNTIEVRNNPSQALISCSSSDSTAVVGNHIMILTGNTAAVTAILLGADMHSAVGNFIHFETAQAHKGIVFSSSRSNMNITNNEILCDSQTAGSVGIDVSSGANYTNISGNNTLGFEKAVNATGAFITVINNNLFNDTTTAITATNAVQTSIQNNVFSTLTTAISIVNTAVKKNLNISGNTVNSCGNNAFSLQGIAHSTISNNTFIAIGTGTNNTYDCIMLTSTGVAYSVYNVVSGNNISSVSANKHRYGIRENSANDGPNIITNNVSLNAATANISTQHASTDVSHNLTV